MKLKGQLRWHARPIAMTVLVAVLGLSLWAAFGPRPAPVGTALDAIPYYSLPFGPDARGQPRPFWPSRLASATGLMADPAHLPSSADFAGCHPREFSEWAGSLHAIADRDLVYEKTVEANEHIVRDPEQGRFCEGCHAPNQMLTGRVTSLAAVAPTEALSEGVACISCHTAVHAEPETGNGALTLAYGRAETDSQQPQGAALLADPRAHLAAFAAPDTAALVKSADLCGACHTEIYDLSMSKAEVPQAVQSTFTEWRDSWYGKNGVTCQDCHMAADPAAQITALRAGKPVKPERISHRFIGTNHLMADPGLGDTRSLLRGGLLPGMDSAGDAATLAEQSRQTEAFLRAAAGLDLRAQRLTGDRLSLDIAVQNLGAGHNLPTGVNDQKHMWLEITLTDAQDRVVYQSGQDGAEALGTAAWLEHFRDAKGERITNHLTFATAEVVWIRKPIAAKSEEIVSYDIALPADAAFPLHLSARLMFRVALPDLLFKNLGHRALAVPAFAMAELGREIPGN